MASLSEEENIKSEDGTASDDIEDHEVLKTPAFDATFSTQTWREDTALVVQGKRLYVASSILSFVSPVFTKMFDESFGGERPREIVLKEKKYDDVVEFLLCLYPNVQKVVDSANVCIVLPLAVEYDAKLLRDKCEDFLTLQARHETQLEYMCLYLNTACTLEMTDVKETCIQRLSESDYPELLKAEERFPLPLEVKVEIQHRIIVFLEKTLKTLIKVDIKKFWLDDSPKILKDFESGSVGYVEYSDCLPKYGHFEEGPAISINGIDWNIRVSITDDRSSLCFYLKAKSSKGITNWSCRAYAVLTLRSYETEEDSVSRSFDHVFTAEENDWGFSEFLSMNILRDPQKHFVKNRKVHLDIKFIVNKPSLIIKW